MQNAVFAPTHIVSGFKTPPHDAPYGSTDDVFVQLKQGLSQANVSSILARPRQKSPVGKRVMRSCPRCLTPYATKVEFCGIDGTRLRVFNTDPLIGTEVDRYNVIGHLGDGAMARVYRARHQVLDRDYAIKVLFGEVASNQILAERFRREAHAMSKMNHPNIVSVVDFGSTPTGLTFLTMELVEGRTLRWIVRKTGPLGPYRSAHIVRQIAEGLREAHGQGFVHRDLKPSNVMVTEDPKGDKVKILDFGLVRAASPEHEEAWLTKTGQFVGTPTYMAPEQITGERVDELADLYSLGVILYEMLEGRPPFRAKRVVEIQQKHLTAIPPAPKSAFGLDTLAMGLLEKSPKSRPQTAAAVIERIKSLSIPKVKVPPLRSSKKLKSNALSPDTPSMPRGPSARDRFDLGIALRQLERFDEAIREFKAAALASSRSVDALEQIGQCYMDKKEWTNAIHYFKKALEQGASGRAAANLKFEIGLAYEHCQKANKAKKWFQAAYRTDPNHRDVSKRLKVLGIDPILDRSMEGDSLAGADPKNPLRAQSSGPTVPSNRADDRPSRPPPRTPTTVPKKPVAGPVVFAKTMPSTQPSAGTAATGHHAGTDDVTATVVLDSASDGAALKTKEPAESAAPQNGTDRSSSLKSEDAALGAVGKPPKATTEKRERLDRNTTLPDPQESTPSGEAFPPPKSPAQGDTPEETTMVRGVDIQPGLIVALLAIAILVVIALVAGLSGAPKQDPNHKPAPPPPNGFSGVTPQVPVNTGGNKDGTRPNPFAAEVNKMVEKKKPEPQITGFGVEADKLKARLATAARQRGLSLADLDIIPGLTEENEAWNTAKKEKHIAKLHKSFGALEPKLRTVALDRRFVSERAKRLSHELAEKSKEVPLDQLQALEDRVLSLSATIKPKMSPEACEKFARAASKISRDIQKAGQASAAR